MKKILFFLSIFISLNTMSFAQNVKLTASELEAVLIKQCGIEYAMMGTKKISQRPGAVNFDFLFKKNGTFDKIDEDGTDCINLWKYDTENNSVELFFKDKVTTRIKSITKSKLIITLVPRENDPPSLFSMKIHLKPI